MLYNCNGGEEPPLLSAPTNGHWSGGGSGSSKKKRNGRGGGGGKKRGGKKKEERRRKADDEGGEGADNADKSEGEDENPEEKIAVSEEFKRLVFHSLSSKALAPYHVLLEVQLRTYTNDEFEPSLRTTATLAKVERALESLENVDGLVEKVEGRQQGER